MAISKLRTVFANGSWINNVKTFFNKINEIIDNVNSQPTILDYPTFKANTSQAEGAAPVITMLKPNTLGATITWTRDSAGNYFGTPSSNIFPDASKVFCQISGSTAQAQTINSIRVADFLGGGNIIGIQCYDPVAVDFVDNALLNNSIEVTIYP